MTDRQRDRWPALPLAQGINAADVTDLGTVVFRGDVRSYAWDGGSDLSGGADAGASAGFLLDSSAGAGQFQQIYAEGGAITNIDLTDVTVEGDVKSANWDGSSPATVPDTGATAGFYLDSSLGSAQFEGDVYTEGTLYTTSDPAAGGRHLRINPGTAQRVGFYNNGTLEGYLENITSGIMVLHGNDNVTITSNANITLGVEPGSDVYIERDSGSGDYPQLFLPNGSASLPSLSTSSPTSDPNSGIFFPGADVVGISTGGTESFRVDSSQNVNFGSHVLYGVNELRVADGSASNPSLTFSGDQTTGMYRPGTDQIALAVASTQELLIGTAGFVVQNVYDSTNASAANVFVDTDGRLFRSTSLEATKDDVRPFTANGKVLTLRPITFYPKAGNPAKGEPLRRQGTRKRLGLGAHHTVGVDPRFATFGPDGVEGIDWNAVVSALILEVAANREVIRQIQERGCRSVAHR